MSHFVEIRLVIKDQKALVRALERMGFAGKVQSHDTARNVRDYWGNKSPVMAEVIVPREHFGHADFGFEKQKDGTFKAHMDSYDQGRLGAKWEDKLSTFYGIEKTKIELEHKGMKYTEDLDEKQRPRIRIRMDY